MFDEIAWEQPLPDGRVPSGTVFQTKSLGRRMTRFTVTADGRLIEHLFRYVTAERDPADSRISIPFLQTVPLGDVDTHYHGDILMHAFVEGSESIEYGARFTRGDLEWVRPAEALSEEHKQRLLYFD